MDFARIVRIKADSSWPVTDNDYLKTITIGKANSSMFISTCRIEVLFEFEHKICQTSILSAATSTKGDVR